MANDDCERRARLQKTIDSLVSEIDEWFESCPEADVASRSKSAVLDIFNKRQYEVKQLFSQAEGLHRKNPKRWVTMPREDASMTFWHLLIGGRHHYTLAYTSTNILAIILSGGIGNLLEVWDDFLKHLGMRSNESTACAHASNGFNDEDLPFTELKWRSYFPKDEHAPAFANRQHKYCQVHPEDIDVRFEGQRDILRKFLFGEFKTCARFDKKGRRSVEEKDDKWFPESSFVTLLSRYEATITRLYVGWHNGQFPVPARSNYAERRKYYQTCESPKATFYESLKSRTKIFAILIATRADGSSETWKRFIEACLNNSENALTDTILPLPFHDIKTHFSSADQEEFDTYQFKFCPVHLCKEREVEWKHERWCLPFEKTTMIGDGGFGEIYNVKIAEHYRLAEDEANLAMKVVDANESFSEWRLQKTISSQDMMSSGIMAPKASLTKANKTYLFMQLATCDLHKYMMHKTGPQNRDSLVHMLSVARALRYLHCDLFRDKKVKEVCIHGDIKTRNILCINDQSNVKFRIADFGISIFEQVPKAVPDGEELPGSAREVQIQSRLSKAAENFPPELEYGGQGNASIDIWGFGTVFSEYVAWIAGGAESLKRFVEARSSPGTDYDKQFYYRTGPREKPRLKEGIRRYFTDLVEQAKDESAKKMYASCWDLIHTSLLNCDPKERLRIEEVCDKVLQICNGQDMTFETKERAPPFPQPSTPKEGQADPLTYRPSTDSGRTSTPSSRSKQSGIAHSTSDPVSPSEMSQTRSRGSGGLVWDEKDRAGTPLSSRSTPVRINGPEVHDIDLAKIESRSASHLERSSLEATTSGARQPPDDSIKLQRALRNLDGKEASRYINVGTDVEFLDEGESPLHMAVLCEDCSATKELLKHHSWLLRKKNKSGLTPLHSCIEPCALEHAELLLKSDDPSSQQDSILSIPDISGRTPLQYATDLGPRNKNDREMVRRLRWYHKKNGIPEGKPGKFDKKYRR